MSSVTRVVTTCLNGHRAPTVGANREFTLGVLDQALRLRPDIVCLPEACTTNGVAPVDGRQVAEQVPGMTTEAVAERARRGQCYIICPMYTERDGAIHNSALLFDRSGEITGIYDKVHPVTSMPDYTVFESGTTPGTEAATFDLDCGRVGIQICFDVGFPETWAVLAQRGARLVFWPSAYHGGLPLQTYASLHQYYVVTSVGRDRSRIIDPCGRVVRETDAQVNVVAYDLNLDFAVCHYDFNYAIPDRIMEKYGDRVRVSSYVDDGVFIVEPLDEGITSEALQQEFGFESMQAYYDFHRRGYRSLAEGTRPAPQKARHGARAQYRKTTGDRSKE